MTGPIQTELFGEPLPPLPEGFRYEPAVVPRSLETSLIAQFSELPFKAFEFHGFEGKRRVVSYGWKYDFAAEALRPTEEMPAFLHPVRALAAQFAGMAPDRLQQALITEYQPGAPIGWHKDKAVFGRVVGISLLSPCIFRLRRKVAGKWERASLTLEPGSGYLIAGPAREQWEHSIPPVDALRYSITFRELQD
jgi:alkylated DNA repair dioxygenase AlkB